MNPDLAAKIETFRTKAQEQGIAPEKINAFIAQKTGQTSPAALPQQATQVGIPQGTNFQLSPQQVMAAQLFLPEQQAKALSSAYDIQLKAQEQQAKQAETQKQAQQAQALKDRTLQAAQDLAGTKYGGITGVRSIGSFLPGTKEQEARAAFDQLKGLLTLENVSYLKGTGALSDREMAILERASTKLNTNLSDKAFEKELNTLITQLGGTPAMQEEGKKKVVQPTEQPELLNQALGMGATQPSMQPTGTQLDQVIQPTEDFERQPDLLDKTISALPTIGAIMGGIVGAGAGIGLGGGVGGIPGGAIGSAAGSAIGRGLAETIQDLTGRQDETTAEALKSQVVEAGQAGVADLVTGGLFKVGAPIIKNVGSKLVNLGDDFALRALRPTKTQQKNFLAKTGQELKDFVIEKGLFKEGTEQVNSYITPLQKSFDDIADKSGVKIPTQDVAKSFQNTIKELNDTGIAGYQSIANSLQNQYDAFLGKFGKTLELDISDVNNLRKSLDKLISESAFTKDSIEAGSDKIARDIYTNIVRGAADNANLADDAGRSLKDIGQELGKLYSFRDIVNTQKYLGTGTLPVGLLRTIGLNSSGGIIGAGISTANPVTVATGILTSIGIPELLNNKKAVAIIANQVPKMGRALQAIPENQRIQVATDMMRRLLTQLGAENIANLGAELAGIE